MNKNNILLPDDPENVKLRVAVNYFFGFTCKKLYTEKACKGYQYI